MPRISCFWYYISKKQGMKRICQIFLGLLFCTGNCGAAVRSPNAIVRQNTSSSNLTARKTTNRTRTNVISRSAISKTPHSYNNTSTNNTGTKIKTVSARSAANTKPISTRSAVISAKRPTRAAITTSGSTKILGNNYVACRDAYFTCMDQFCANQDDTYRRCVCSSKLQQIQSKENVLYQTASDLESFHNYNIDAISKTTAEIQAMQNATVGEQSLKEDKSISAQQLNNIKDVLNNTQQKNNSFESSYDIFNDVASIWGTTNLIQGANIITLYGETLYNAVNSQCRDLVSEQCSASDLKLITSAYSMYIENDCELLQSDINSKVKQANTAVRNTRQEMQKTRLDNYNTHNALSINDCIAKIKEDITAETACGPDYIHCLDFTGKYININTGEPIYSPDFYQLENQISLSGDLLNNVKNKNIINFLNTKQKFAQQTLDSCNNVADDVWEEFLHQTIIEIFQAQQQRINTVKLDCINIVNQCISSTLNDLQNYISNTNLITTKQTLDLTTQLCQKEITTCTNMYGGDETLIAAITSIQNNYVSPECSKTLDTFVQTLCSVSSTNPYHSYPYGCRVYSQKNCEPTDNNCESLFYKLKAHADRECKYEANDEQDAQDMATTLYVIQTINNVRSALIKQLVEECEKFDGEWVDIEWQDDNTDDKHDVTGDVLIDSFYLQTNTHKSWGYCKQTNETNSETD